MIFHSSGSSGSCYVVHAELKLFLPQPPKCGDYRSMPLLSSGPCWGPLDFSGCYEMYGMRDAAELVEGQASSSTAENGVAVLVSSIILSHCEQNAWAEEGKKGTFRFMVSSSGSPWQGRDHTVHGGRSMCQGLFTAQWAREPRAAGPGGIML